jgi:hypothetical protein
MSRTSFFKPLVLGAGRGIVPQSYSRRSAKLAAFFHRRRPPFVDIGGKIDKMQRLIGFLQIARAAPSVEALDQMQVEVDQLIIAIVHGAEHYDYSPSEQMSFSLVLNRISEAMASRRASLVERPAAESATRSRATAA